MILKRSWIILNHNPGIVFINIIKWFIRIIFWLQIFVVPVLLFGLIAFDIYFKGERYSDIVIGVLGIGIISGIVIAEYIRKKIGLETFFARIYGPDELDQKLQKKKMIMRLLIKNR